ncbi:MAG TPA: DUF1345 domain-containing protein [Candidatus Nanopelagicales bacterium]
MSNQPTRSSEDPPAVPSGTQEAPSARTSDRLENELVARALPAWRRMTAGEPRWPASLAVLVMIVLQLRLGEEFTPLSAWLLPVVELVLLSVLLAVNPRRIDRHNPRLRILGLTLIAVATLFNAWSVVRLAHVLLDGTFHGEPGTLLATGANIWVTNVIVFALWYWELDRGGPGARAQGRDPDPDFLFPQMAETTIDFHHWEPEFVDYAYVSFTNAAAFSPTDTMPLSRWAKLAMLVQSAISLVTAALVIARAVNILK